MSCTMLDENTSCLCVQRTKAVNHEWLQQKVNKLIQFGIMSDQYVLLCLCFACHPYFKYVVFFSSFFSAIVCLEQDFVSHCCCDLQSMKLCAFRLRSFHFDKYVYYRWFLDAVPVSIYSPKRLILKMSKNFGNIA